MRILVISDVHANYTALEAVLNDASSIDEVWCLGDLVGYGPDPNECINRLKNLPKLSCVVGNHDAALMGFIDLHAFNDQAAKAVTIQSELLSEESREFLELLERLVRSFQSLVDFLIRFSISWLPFLIPLGIITYFVVKAVRKYSVNCPPWRKSKGQDNSNDYN